jgi:hypothetical protein
MFVLVGVGSLVAPARISAGAGGAQPVTFTVLGPQPQIHFDVVSFKRCAGLGSSEVDLPTDGDYVAYHGTSTALNDRVETRAVRLAFGPAAERIPGSSIKSRIGHPQGACGAAAVAATVLGMRDGFLPPTINLDDPDPGAISTTSRTARARRASRTLCNCIGSARRTRR